MADRKISDMSLLSQGDLVAGTDYVPVVDPSEVVPADRNKRILASSLVQGTLAQATGNVTFGGTVSETVGGVVYPVASQFDVGTAPNQIPLNQYLGTMAYQDAAGVSVGTLVAALDATVNGMRVGLGGGQIASNTAVGNAALAVNTTGANNVAVGASALFCNTSGNCNSAVGVNTLAFNTTGCSNSAFGVNALLCNTTGCSNSALGLNALRCNTTGGSNSAVGASALSANTTGGSNSAVGAGALSANTTGNCNSAVGLNALFCNTTGDFNNAVGVNALRLNSTGCNNTALGQAAGCAITTGSNLTVLGATAAASSATATNEVTLGNSSVTCLRVPGVGLAFDTTDGLIVPKTITAGGTTGAQTINKTAGSVNFAAAATSLVVTNSFVDANSVIVASVATNDTTMKTVLAVPGAGSFTLHANAAATAETRVNWVVVN